MNIHHFVVLTLLLAAIGFTSASVAAQTPVANLQATYRDGQIFLTWQEAETPAGTTFNVYRHNAPLTTANLTQAQKIGHHVEAHSARDWWQDPASYDADAKPGAPTGFRIAPGAPPLDPQNGLFVHTVTPESAGASYFAITSSDDKGVENKTLLLGANTLMQPIVGQVAIVQPIWLAGGNLPVRGAGQGKSLTLSLHGRGGGKAAGAGAMQVNCLIFGDAKQGWREGLPFKFQLNISENNVRITPLDRVWVGRKVLESGDKRDHVPAINTWWYGYNHRIYETTLTKPAIVPNYTEEYLLGLVRWAQNHLGTNPNKTYVVGGSMGGSGAISLVRHYPHVFAATVANVPVVYYTRRGGGAGSLARLEAMSGPVDETTLTGDGKPFLKHMNGELVPPGTDLPYMFITHGRTDGSIPWENNPPFYAAMNAARQGFAVHWNNGDHSTAVPQAPDDVRAWDKRLERYALNQSFPVFTNSSDNRNPGNGERKDGDIIGWINRGLDWKDVVDSPDEYALTVLADYPGIQLPITLDVTPRRVQRFNVKPNQVVKVQIGTAAPVEMRADENGLVTIRAVKITDKNGTRVRITR